MAVSASVSTLPSREESRLAKETSRILATRLPRSGALSLRLLGRAKEQTIQVPATALRMLVRILDEMAKGNAVTLTPVHTELTTQQAAALLNISRPSLIQLLEEGRIVFRKVGTHRRVRLDSLLEYRRQWEADRRMALAELAAYDQELGL